MRFEFKSYERYVKDLKNELVGKALLVPFLLNNETIVFPVRDTHNSLIVSLNHQNPFIGLLPNLPKLDSFDNDSLKRLRKYLGKNEIKTIENKNNDFTLLIETFDIDNNNSKKIYIEIFPLRPNLYILDEENNVVTTFNLTKDNELPICFLNNTEPSKEFQTKGELYSQEVLEKLYKDEKDRRIKQKYSYFYTLANRRYERILRKKKLIDADLEKGKANLQLMGTVNILYSLNLDLKSHKDYIEYEGQTIVLDKSLTIKENIDSFINLYKKGKRTVEIAKENEERYQVELNYYKSLLENFENASSEKEKDKIVFESGLMKSSHPTQVTAFNMPYKINKDGIFYYFGKNAQQNDYLSFNKKFDREYVWLHVKDKPGAHVIIAKRKPSSKEIDFAAQIALIASKCQVGNVTVAIKKNVRKGRTTGEAILKNYTVIKINNIDDRSYELYEKAVRCDD